MATSRTGRFGLRTYVVKRSQNHGEGEEAVIWQNYSESFETSVTYGDNIPGWRYLIANGLDATTSLVGTQYGGSRGSGIVQHKALWNKETPVQDGFYERSQMEGNIVNLQMPTGNPSGISLTVADNAAKAKFIQKALEVTHQFQGGTFLGELGKTLKMIRNPAQAFRRGITDYTNDLKKVVRASRSAGGRQLTARVVKTAADSWLEYQYGWKPLLSDVENGAKALARLEESTPTFKRITAYGENETVTSSSDHSIHGYAYTSAYDSDYTKVVYRGAVRVTPPVRKTMAQSLLGFDLASFVPTAWELTPYSFLVDYFTNIGDIIQGWSYLRGNLSWVNRTAIQEKRVTAGPGGWGNYLAFQSIHTNSIFPIILVPQEKLWKRQISRAKFTGSLVPDFQFELPNSSTKWINIGGLLASKSVASLL